MTSTRRARAGLELAFWQLETALVLERPDDATAAEAALARRVGAPALDEQARADVDARIRALRHAVVHGGDALRDYAKTHGLAGARTWVSSQGARILRLVTEAFPRHVNYVYVLDLGDALVLWDCGSGIAESRRWLLDGMAVATRALGFAVAPADIDVVFVSHGHYDHFGDAAWWKAQAQAPLWIHELDARVLERFGERTVLGARDMSTWLAGAGCPADEVERLVSMYLASKEVYSAVAVERRLRHGQELFAGRARVIHTPGHCPGHVCLRLDGDVLLVADQVLAPITPHLSPQALHPHNGLERYLTGLSRLARETGVGLVLPAHYDPIPDLDKRIREIAEDHVDKLTKTAEACRDGATVADVAAALFGAQEGYNVLLAILEAGTHVEYLHQLGGLEVKNVDDVAHDARRPLVWRTTASSLELDGRLPVPH